MVRAELAVGKVLAVDSGIGGEHERTEGDEGKDGERKPKMTMVTGNKVEEFISGYDPVCNAWVIGPKTLRGTIDMARAFGAYATAEKATERLSRIISGGVTVEE